MISIKKKGDRRLKYLLTIFSLGLVVMVVACNNNDVTDRAESETEQSISPDYLADHFLDGKFEAIYNQTSDTFKDLVTLQQFKDMGSNFNQGVEHYEVISNMPFQGMTEIQWLSDDGTKGIRSYFAEDDTIEGLQLLPVTPPQDRDDVYTENTYRMPISGEWFVFWGGTNELVNYHYELAQQRYSYDLLVMEDGHSFEGDPTDNESYFAFGEDVLAPLDGVVVSVENGIADNTPTIDTNAENPLGNYVIIEHDNEEYSIIAHFKKESIVVSPGDEVAAGELLGLVGNSGNSSEPHIHFQVSDGESFETSQSIRIQLENNAEPLRGDTVTGF